MQNITNIPGARAFIAPFVTEIRPQPAINSYRIGARDNCRTCPARPIGFCASLTADELKAVSDVRSTERKFPAGAEIYAQGEIGSDYFSVLEGWVALGVTLENGARHILDFGIPGSLLGTASSRGRMTEHSAQCITPVRVCVLPKRRFEQLGSTGPGLTARLLSMSACHETRGHDHLVNISCRNARERVANLLLELFYRLSHRLPARGDSIPFPLKLEHIGDALALTGVHVSRTLKLLREQGIVDLSGRKLAILDPAALSRAAGFEGPIADYDLEPRAIASGDD
jgi:CRP-like cAMP-binding protein